MNRTSLPLIGRDNEVRRVLEFWQGTPEEPGLRACILVGEAGIGKSRLIDEVIARVSADGGRIVHVRLYPDSPLSLAPMILEAPDVGTLSPPNQPLSASAATLLRRLCHLRPTLLILDDVHLLDGEPLREFATLIEQLVNEPLWILCATRPIEGGGRRVIERTLVDEIAIPPLGRKDIVQIWQSMFGMTPDDDVVAAVAHETLGNPLAIRSALRGAISSGAIVRAGGEVWQIAVPIPGFAAALRRHIGYLADGMTIGLQPKELEGVRRLAILGEVFALESALRILEEGNLMIDRLVDSGIIATSPTARTPIVGTTSSHSPLVFTHSLLHRALAEHPGPRERVIVDLIADRLPIYSLHPIRLLIGSGAPTGTDPDRTQDAITSLVEAALTINTTSDWEMAGAICDATEALARSHPTLPTELQGGVILARLEMVARDPTSDRHVDLTNRLLQLVSSPGTTREAELLLHALRNSLWRTLVRDQQDPRPVLDQVSRLVGQFPLLRTSEGLLTFLRLYARVVASIDLSYEAGRGVDSIFASLIDDPALDAGARRLARRNRAIALAWLFESDDELKERRLLLEEAVMEGGEPETELLIMLVLLNDDTGNHEEARRWIDFSLPLFRRRGQTYLEAGSRSMLLWQQEGPHGGDLTLLRQRLDGIIEELPPAMGARLRRNVVRLLVMIAGLREETDALSNICGIDELDIADRGVIDALRCGIDRTVVQGGEGLTAMAQNGGAPVEAGSIIIEGRNDRESIALLRSAILSHPLRLSADLYRRAIYSVIAATRTDPERHTLYEALHDDIVAAIRISLAWHVDRGFSAYIERFLERWHGLLDDHEMLYWRDRIAAMKRAREGRGKRTESAIRIRVIGSVEVTRSDGTILRPRAGRIQRLIAMMVADHLLARAMGPADFHQLLDEGGNDPARGRKGMNLAVHRLRESLGRECVLTDSDTPRLNLDRVNVDLLQVDQSLRDAMNDVRGGYYARARVSVEKALSLLGSEVVFAGLYDDFFEALRDDMENRVRRVVMTLAERLLNERGFEEGALLLEKATTAIPGDGALLELLGEAYARGNRQAEAERTRVASG